MKRTLKIVLFTGVLTLLSAQALSMPVPPSAAGGPPGGSPPTGTPPAGGPPCWTPPCVPIDGGIGFLLAAGAFVGVRRIYKVRQEEKLEQ